MMYLGQACTYRGKKCVWAGFDFHGAYLWLWEYDGPTEIRLPDISEIKHIRKAGVQQLGAEKGIYLGKFAVELNAGFFGKLDLATLKAFPTLWQLALIELGTT